MRAVLAYRVGVRAHHGDPVICAIWVPVFFYQGPGRHCATIDCARVERLGRPEVASCGVPADGGLHLIKLRRRHLTSIHEDVEVNSLSTWRSCEGPIVVPVEIQIETIIELLEVDRTCEGGHIVVACEASLCVCIHWVPHDVKAEAHVIASLRIIKAPVIVAVDVRRHFILKLRQEGVCLEAGLEEHAKDAIALIGVASVQSVDAMGFQVNLGAPHGVLRTIVVVALNQGVRLCCSSDIEGHTPLGGPLGCELNCVAVVEKFHVLICPGDGGLRPLKCSAAEGEVDGTLHGSVLAERVVIARSAGPVAMTVGVPVLSVGH
mmetsp:Transcript_64795/g.146121  ORF Transcript_64795/g.146121 Transcript_64795/m.146121 type:complete len:320 (-) Transcript_64795:3154-4113(-)